MQQVEVELQKSREHVEQSDQVLKLIQPLCELYYSETPSGYTVALAQNTGAF